VGSTRATARGCYSGRLIDRGSGESNGVAAGCVLGRSTRRTVFLAQIAVRDLSLSGSAFQILQAWLRGVDGRSAVWANGLRWRRITRAQSSGVVLDSPRPCLRLPRAGLAFCIGAGLEASTYGFASGGGLLKN